MPDTSTQELGLSEEELTGKMPTSDAISTEDPPRRSLADALRASSSEPPADPAPKSEAAKPTENSTMSAERRIAQGIIDARAAQVDADLKSGKVVRTDLSNGDKAIWDAYMFREGLPEGKGTRIDKGEGVTIKVNDQELVVVSISSGRTEDGQRVYSGKAKDPLNPDGPPKDIPNPILGTALADAYTAKHAGEVAQSFPEGAQRDLVAWHAAGGEGSPPPSTAELIKRETDPAYNAAQIIQENLNLLRREINNAPEGTDLTNQNRLIAQLETAQILAGSGFENLATAGALQSLGKDRVPELDNLVGAFQPGMLEEYNKLEPELLKAGLNDPQLEILKTQGLNLLSPDGADIIQKLAGMEGLEKFLPQGVTPEQLMTKLEATLTPTQKEWWDTNKDKLGTGAWTALLILLAVPVIAMGAAVAAVGTAAGAGGRR